MEPFERSTIRPERSQGPAACAERLHQRAVQRATGSGDTPSRRKIFVCHPANASEELPCAKKIITTLARHAYRRPVTDADLETLLSFYQSGRNKRAISKAESRWRCAAFSPIRSSSIASSAIPPALRPDTPYRVSDLELASRLSFFLWSSIPDDELLDVAAQGKLHDPAVLEHQVRRMLADPRADSLVTNFADQWLYLRNLRSVAPDLEDVPQFRRQSARRHSNARPSCSSAASSTKTAA